MTLVRSCPTQLHISFVIKAVLCLLLLAPSVDAFAQAQSAAHVIPKEAAGAQKAYAKRSKAPEDSTLVTWEFLNETDVTVSDGKKDAVIKYPASIKALDGKRVSIIGFMTPWEKLDDLTEFMVMPGYVGCFLCTPPAVTQVSWVKQRNPGKQKIPFVEEPIIVTGTLRLFTFASPHPAHQADFMYALDDAVVELYTGKDKPSHTPEHLDLRRRKPAN